jgi:hypothetical protein
MISTLVIITHLSIATMVLVFTRVASTLLHATITSLPVVMMALAVSMDA